MLPIPDRAWITGEFIQNWSYLKEGDACIILTLDEGIVFKLLGNKISTKKPLRLVSMNSFYKPFDIQVKEIREIWKFVNYISNELPEPVSDSDEIRKTVANLKQDIDRIKASINK